MDPGGDFLSFSAATADLLPFYMANYSAAGKRDFGHQLADAVPLCTFNGVKCEDGDFKTFYDEGLGLI